MDLNKMWKKILGNNNIKSQPTSSKPFIHEVIDKEIFKSSAYTNWIISSGFKILDQHISNSFNLWQNNKSCDSSIVIVNNQASSGINVNIENDNTENVLHYLYFLNVLKQRFESLNYDTTLSEVKSTSYSEYIKTEYHYYLKPKYSLRTTTSNGKKPQLYGNISLKYVLYNDRPKTLRILCTKYMDSCYEEPLDFGEMMNKIFIELL